MENSDLYNIQPKTEEKAKGKKGKVIFSLLIAVFCLVIFGGGISLVTGEDREFSETENRVLAAMPSLSFYSVKDGSFMKDFESYLTDQFIFRDGIIRLKTVADRMVGKTKTGGAYIGKDGYLFSVPTPFDEKRTEELMGKISTFAELNPESRISFMLSPNSSYVYKEKLPDHLTLEDQNYRIQDIENCTLSEKVEFINLSEVFLSKKDEIQLFYKTDHHWTTRAANIAFSELMKKWNKSAEDVSFDFLVAADGFRGTLSSKSGVISSDDIIEICVPQNSSFTYVVEYDGPENKSATLFDGSKLDGKNKYEVFTGGNHGIITIRTTSPSKDTLLLIKDSYANCMLPMLTPFFAKIVVFDPRYTQEKLSSVTEENTFSHILFLYNLNTFLEDTSLGGALE